MNDVLNEYKRNDDEIAWDEVNLMDVNYFRRKLMNNPKSGKAKLQYEVLRDSFIMNQLIKLTEYLETPNECY